MTDARKDAPKDADKKANGADEVVGPVEALDAKRDSVPASPNDASPSTSKTAAFAPTAVIVYATSVVVALIMLLGDVLGWWGSTYESTGENPPVTRIEDQPDPGDVDAGRQDGGEESGDLDYERAEDVLGIYEARTTAADEAVRSKNLQAAARALNGIVIEPDGTLSLNETIGDPTPERGYESVVGVEYATDAVDQVATALYIASLKAGLTAPVRYAHVIAVDYAPLGMDAAVAWGLDDLVIHNDLDEAVTIQATASGTSVTVSVFGAVSDPSVTRDVSATVSDTYSRPASEVYEDPLAQGYLSSDSIRFSVVKTYLETYRDGELETSELLHVDTYQMPGASSEAVDESAPEQGDV